MYSTVCFTTNLKQLVEDGEQVVLVIVPPQAEQLRVHRSHFRRLGSASVALGSALGRDEKCFFDEG